MKPRLGKALAELGSLSADLKRMVNGRWWRWATIWTNAPAWTNVTYRFDRTCYLALGDAWAALRPIAFPVFIAFRAMGGRGDIHYRAEIGPGLLVLHPELGVVVSGHAIVGANLVLTGGNCLGERAGADNQSYVVGDDVTLGANAVVIGPVRIGDRVTIGAGAVVVDEAPDGAVLVGVPAKPVPRTR